MTTSNIKTTIPCDLEKIWKIITSLQDYAWRSDISNIKIVNDHQFIEYTKDGYATTFTITVKAPMHRYEFNMDNSNMRGHWTGLLHAVEGGVEIDFTEDVTAKKAFMKSFVKSYLKKQQHTYIQDLEKACQDK